MSSTRGRRALVIVLHATIFLAFAAVYAFAVVFVYVWLFGSDLP